MKANGPCFSLAHWKNEEEEERLGGREQPRLTCMGRDLLSGSRLGRRGKREACGQLPGLAW